MSTDPYDSLLDSLERKAAPQPKPARPSNRYGAYEAQTEGDWSISRAPQVKDWYRQTYGRDLPVTAEGQSRTHNRMGLNHADSMDVGLNPTTSEGQAFVSYLKQNRIPFLAYDRAVPNAASGPHVHVGYPSHRGAAQATDPYAKLLDELESSPATSVPPQSPEAGTVAPTISQAQPASAGVPPPSPKNHQLEPGNIDLTKRPVVHNPDGTISTVRSMSANFDGREVLIPTVSDDGRILTEAEAVDLYKRTGKHLGIFDSPEAATEYAKRLHEQQAEMYGGQGQTTPQGSAPPQPNLGYLDETRERPEDFALAEPKLKPYNPDAGLSAPAAMAQAAQRMTVRQPGYDEGILEPISATIHTTGEKPSTSQAVDALMEQLGPGWKELAQRYRSETGREPIDVGRLPEPEAFDYRERGTNWRYSLSPTKDFLDTMKAYEKGGLEEASRVATERANAKVAGLNKSAQDEAAKPYLGNPALSLISPLAPLIGSQVGEDVTKGAMKTMQGTAQLAENLRKIHEGEAFGDANQEQIDRARASMPGYRTNLGGVLGTGVEVGGDVARMTMLPGVSAPLEQFLENYHRGGYEAAKAAGSIAALEAVGVGGDKISKLLELTPVQRQVFVRALQGDVNAAQAAMQDEKGAALLKSFGIGAAFPVGKGERREAEAVAPRIAPTERTARQSYLDMPEIPIRTPEGMGVVKGAGESRNLGPRLAEVNRLNTEKTAALRQMPEAARDANGHMLADQPPEWQDAERRYREAADKHLRAVADYVLDPSVTPDKTEPSLGIYANAAHREALTELFPDIAAKYAQKSAQAEPGTSEAVPTPAAGQEAHVAPTPEPVPHHSQLQPRRVRGEGKGQFKKETASQREERLTAEVKTPTIEYKKVAPVKAEVAKESFEWQTSDGQKMRAEAGDWKVTHPDGSVGSVKPSVFKKTYEPAPGEPGKYVKTATTKAQVLDRPVKLVTLEGPQKGGVGDYLVTGPEGEQYVVPKKQFEELYRPVGGTDTENKTSAPRGEGVGQGAPRIAVPAPPTAERSFPQSAEAAGLSKGTNTTYEVQADAPAVERASARIEAQGADKVAADIARNREPSKDDVVAAQLLAKKYSEAGDHEREVAVISDLAEKLTKAGQSVQAASLISRLSPEGVLIQGQRLLNKRRASRTLTAEEAAALKETAGRVREYEAKATDLQRQIEEMKLRPQRAARPKLETFEERLGRLESDARARLEARKAQAQAVIAQNGQAGATSIIPDLADYAIVGAVKLAKKGVTVARWTDEMVSEFGDEIKPHLRAIYQQSYAQLKTEREAARREAQERAARRDVPGPMRPEDVRRLVAERTQAQKDAQRARGDLERTFRNLSRTKAEKVAEAGTSFRRANLLTAAKTHLRNITSNTGFQGTEEASRPLAAVGDMIAKRKTGMRTTYGLNIPAVVRSTIAAGLTEGPARARDIMLGREVLPLEGYRPGAESMGSKMQLHESETGSKILDAYVNTVYRSLEAEDAVFKVYAFRRELADIAHSQAEAERAKDPSVNVRERTRELQQNPTDAMLTEASAYADYATFQNKNVVSEAIAQGKRTLTEKAGPLPKFAIESIAPFDRTPTNIIARTIENSPAGFISAAMKYRRIGKRAAAEQLAGRIADEAFTRAEQKDFARTFGRASTGTILSVLGMALAHKGLLSGASDYDTDKKDYMEKHLILRDSR